MDYYINEYSLRGQFQTIDDFFTSLREYTLPLLKKIEEDDGSIIWKKEDLWNTFVCENIKLSEISKHTKNERNPESSAIKTKLCKLYSRGPYWESELEKENIIVDYFFDLNYKDVFAEDNCFKEAIRSEGQIISFLHDEYKDDTLEFEVKKNNECFKLKINNVYCLSLVKNVVIKTWKENAYCYEVRYKEYEYHPPHFHVSTTECKAVYKLPSCELYKHSGSLTNKFSLDVKTWLAVNKKSLIDAWNEYHGHTTYVKIT